MAASTPSMCLRSDSDSVHSQTRDQASSRLGAAMRGRGYPARRPKLWRVGLGSLTRLAREKFIMEGGTPLAGTITPAGNKNAALPGLAACLLTREEVVLRNIPRIRDVEAMLELLRLLDVKVEWRDENVVTLQADGLSHSDVDRDWAERIRASFLLAGPLLARRGRADMPPPGGDVIGRRRLDPHLDAFRALGAEVGHGRDIDIKAPQGGLRACDFFMDEPSVMGTENALMAAALIDGTTVIRNAASEPHVQDLARMLVKMGAAIEGIGSNVMTVHGLSELGGCEHCVSPDHIEIGSFMALAGVTGGELCIKECVADDLRMIRLAFQRLGLRSEMRENGDCLVPGDQDLRVERDAGDYQSKIEDGPWPAFPADLTSIAVALATQADGSVLIFEKMFENRLFFVDELITMGAEITICDPHRAIVIGPRKLRGQRLSSPDIRAGMAKLIAALCAQGRSEIHNVRQIDRGYERIDERLRDLGANIERLATE